MSKELIKNLGLGTVQFGLDYGISNKAGKTDSTEVKKIIDICVKNYITVIDTAEAYGSAEAVLGQFELNSFKVVSKFMGNAPIKSCKKSLTALNCNQLYGYLAHRTAEFLKPKTYESLLELKKNGTVKKIGVSINEINEIEAVLESNLDFDLIQIPFNYFDRRFHGYFKVLKSQGVEIHSRSTFLQGLFFRKVDTLHSFFNPFKPYIKKLQNMSSLASHLLLFSLNQPLIDYTIIGVNNSEQLRNNLSNLKNNSCSLPQNDFQFAEELLTPSKWPSNG